MLTSFALLQACQHAESLEPQTAPDLAKINLSNAAQYNVQLGLAYLKQGDRPRAKKKLLTALNQAPRLAQANAAMAYFFEQTADIDHAQAYYLKAISYAKNQKDAVGAQYNNYGTFLCRQGDYNKAEFYFLKAIKEIQYVKTAAAYENAGLCSSAQGDERKARFYFTKALEQDPSRRESLYELAKIESKKGHHAHTLKLLNKYPELVRNDPVFLAFAKEVAKNAYDLKLPKKYDNNLALINSGVANEHNDHIG